MPSPPLTLEDFNSVDWEGEISSLTLRTHGAYSAAYRLAADRAHEEENATGERVFRTLALWMQPAPNLDQKRPYPEVFLNSFSEQDNQILRELAPQTVDAELRSRLADLAWIGRVDGRRDLVMAELAVSAYLVASNNFTDQREWPERSRRIERALKIASQGPPVSVIDQVWQHIESILASTNGNDDGLLSLRLMELMQEGGRGDAALYAPMAEKAATRAVQNRGIGQWDKARRYYTAEANWYPPENAQRARALRNAAETYVYEAQEEQEVFGNLIGASMHIQRAIQALREIESEDLRERIEQLRRNLVALNREAQKTFETFKQPLETERYQKQAIALIEGKSLEQALGALLLMFGPPPLQTLRDLVETTKDEFIESMTEKQIVNEEGQIIAIPPSLFSPDPKKREVAIQLHMFEIAGHFHVLHVHGFILPSLHQIQREHNMRVHDWANLLRHSPFVPSGRLQIYARAFQAGLEGDWLVSTHLLVPQIENSIRYILEQSGFIASALHPNSTQSEQGLDVTLVKEELKTLLPEEFIFDLRALLIEKTGSYFRHKTCHGLVSIEAFQSADSVYLWWTALCLCLLPILNVSDDEPTPQSTLTGGSQVAKAEGEQS